MIVDSSAIVAVLRQEPDAPEFHRALVTAGRARISAANLVETAIVIDSAGDPVASRRLDDYLRDMDIRLVDLSARHAGLAREAHRDFGRGSGHPAKLNYGDCFAYALAKDVGEPLLFKGDGFSHTDVIPALSR